MSMLQEALRARGAEVRGQYAEHIAPGWRCRLPGMLILGMVVGVYVLGLVVLKISPARIFAGLWRLGDIVGLMLPPNPETWDRVGLYLNAMGQTLAIAFLGTLMAAMLAFPFGFLAARNVVPNFVPRLLTRRCLDSFRSIDTLVWALIWINVVGLGPFAGALAIMSSDFGAFGKMMSEAVEAADRKPVEGVLSVGGGRLHGVWFGILPQVLPVFASQVLYYFESNTRSATIIGIVGAGGIGLHLAEQIRVLEWQQVSFIILLILVVVMLIDAVSTRLRMAIIGRRG